MDEKYLHYVEEQDELLSDFATKSLKTLGRKEQLVDGGNRTEYERDCNRILHSLPFRRLKHKTQVFFDPQDDHICTRMEHSLHVSSISITICKQLKLNATLAEAIALGHDLGHPPFGHLGEKVLNDIHKKRKMHDFMHEAQSLRVADCFKNRLHPEPLNLTYEVRDGIVCHYGEGDENVITPEQKDIKSVTPEDARKHLPATIEGCVVRIADRISYLGRDFEDAIMAGFLDNRLISYQQEIGLGKNNSQIIGRLIDDLVANSGKENRIGYSNEIAGLVKKLNDYNYGVIYKNPKLKDQERRIRLILTELFRHFLGLLPNKIKQKSGYYYGVFREFLSDMRYARDVDERQKVTDFIAGMTDRFALSCFEDLFRVKSII